MMHLVNVFLFVPEAGWLVNKYKVLVFVVYHFRYIVKVHILKEDKDLAHVHRVHRTSNTSLATVKCVHVVVIVTVSV